MLQHGCKMVRTECKQVLTEVLSSNVLHFPIILPIVLHIRLKMSSKRQKMSSIILHFEIKNPVATMSQEMSFPMSISYKIPFFSQGPCPCPQLLYDGTSCCRVTALRAVNNKGKFEMYCRPPHF